MAENCTKLQPSPHTLVFTANLQDCTMNWVSVRRPRARVGIFCNIYIWKINIAIHSKIYTGQCQIYTNHGQIYTYHSPMQCISVTQIYSLRNSYQTLKHTPIIQSYQTHSNIHQSPRQLSNTQIYTNHPHSYQTLSNIHSTITWHTTCTAIKLPFHSCLHIGTQLG